MMDRIGRPAGASECFNPECRSTAVFFVADVEERGSAVQIACAMCGARSPWKALRAVRGPWTERMAKAREEVVRLWNAIERSGPLDPPLKCGGCGAEFKPVHPDDDPHDGCADAGWGWNEDGDYFCQVCAAGEVEDQTDW